MRESIRKNPSSILVKDKVKLEYISEKQSSLFELVFEIELDQN